MAHGPEARFLSQARIALESILGLSALRPTHESSDKGVDLLLQGPDIAFAVECKRVGDAANVGSALRQLSHFTQQRGSKKKLVPILAVPYMGETGRRLCAEAGVSWIDLSGNAWIDAPGRQIRILGNRNRFAAAGRPANVFAPRSSRLIRAFLMQPQRAFSQAELGSVSGVDKGRVSRLVRRMEAMGLLEKDASEGYRLKDASVALEAWREAYDFRKHHVLEGHVSVRDPDELLKKLEKAAPPGQMSWALTGLAAAWQLTHFAMYRLTSVFVREVPSRAWLESLGFQEEPRGANVWILSPTDDAVFVGARRVHSVPCVHPLQAYLDLKAHPERASEAAAPLRRLVLGESPG